MQTFNFHTHTARCNHAEGADREYVESAIKGGIKTLGFSDHSPYVFKDGYYSGFRMKPEELEGYVKSILDLKKSIGRILIFSLALRRSIIPNFSRIFLRSSARIPSTI